ncbi:MAG: hypothetical protein H6713_10000 [Myxococcales bacterium]|nr:hypothetical protein [Myxococcales bacterium]MCB9750319.1 hypothetical protein [Myxococcales bacterium]
MKISLTDFVDFVTRSGLPKLTLVRQLKHRGEYNTLRDFYRPLREAMIRAHADALGKRHVPASIAGAWDWGVDRRRRHFEELARAYLGWWGRKRLTWFEPGWDVLELGALSMSINPELGLRIDGRPTMVKLYFKERPLSHKYADIVTKLMEMSLGEQAPAGAQMAVLDIRRRNLHCRAPKPHLEALVRGEMAALTTMWSRV